MRNKNSIPNLQTIQITPWAFIVKHSLPHNGLFAPVMAFTDRFRLSGCMTAIGIAGALTIGASQQAKATCSVNIDGPRYTANSASTCNTALTAFSTGTSNLAPIAVNGGASLTLSGTTVSIFGGNYASNVVRVENTGSYAHFLGGINLTGTSSSSVFHGLFANTSSTIQVDGYASIGLTNTTASAIGVIAQSGASVILKGGASITAQTNGILATDGGYVAVDTGGGPGTTGANSLIYFATPGSSVTSLGPGLLADSSSGNAMVTMRAGTVTTTGDNGEGLYAYVKAGTGDANVTMSGGSVTTSGHDADGIVALVRDSNALTAVPGSASVTFAGGTITTSGQGSAGIVAQSDISLVGTTGNASVTQSGGSIHTTGASPSSTESSAGIVAIATTTGTVTINQTAGSILTEGTGSHGIFTESSHGTTTITQTDGATITATGTGADGIHAMSYLDGHHLIDVAGQVQGGSGSGAGIRLIGGGGSEVYVRSTGQVSAPSGTAIYDNAGAMLLESSGVIQGDIQALSGNDTVRLLAGSTTTGQILLGADSDVLSVFNGANISGVTRLDGGDDTTTGDGQIDALTLNGGWSGTLSGANTRNFEILYIDGGTVSFSDAAISVSSDPGTYAPLSTMTGFPVPYGIVVNNAGTLDASNALAVNGNVTLREGTLRVGNGGTSSASISGYLDNASASTVDLSSHGAATGDRLHVGGNYLGGGTLRMDAALDATNASDLVVIDGVVVSGRTSILITDVGNGTGTATGIGPGLGIRLVDVSTTRGTAPGDFVLAGGPIVVNAFNYDLYLHTDGIWYLQSQVRAIVPGLVSASHVVDDIALTFVGTLHERVGEQEQLAGSTYRRGTWARIIGQRSNDNFDTDTVGHIDARTTLTGFQGGFDLRRWTWQDGSSTHAGISLGYAHADSTARSFGIGGSTSHEGALAGLHLTHYDRAGWYADAGLYGAWLDVDAKASGDKLDTQSTSWLASIEMGRAFKLGWGGLSLEPQGQLIYHHRSFDNIADDAIDWRFTMDDALVGRLGVRLKSTANLDPDGRRKATGYVKASLWGVLAGGDERIDIATLPVSLERRDAWADVGLGFTVEAAEGLSIFADGDVEFDVGGADHYAISGKAGVRLNW